MYYNIASGIFICFVMWFSSLVRIASISTMIKVLAAQYGQGVLPDPLILGIYNSWLLVR